MDVIKGEFEKGDDSDPWVKWKQGGIIGEAALAGGAVLTVIGVVVAPAISQGFGAVLQHWEVCNLPLVQVDFLQLLLLLDILVIRFLWLHLLVV